MPREAGDDRTIVEVSDSLLDKVTQSPLAYFDHTLPTFADSAAFPPGNVTKDVTKLTLQRGGQTWEVAQETADGKTTYLAPLGDGISVQRSQTTAWRL